MECCSLTRLVAAQNPGVPFWDLVRLSIYLSIDRPEVSIQMTEVARFLNFENLRQTFCRMLV